MTIADLEEHRRRREEGAKKIEPPIGIDQIVAAIQGNFRKMGAVARYRQRIGVIRHNGMVLKKKGKRRK